MSLLKILKRSEALEQAHADLEVKHDAVIAENQGLRCEQSHLKIENKQLKSRLAQYVPTI